MLARAKLDRLFARAIPVTVHEQACTYTQGLERKMWLSSRHPSLNHHLSLGWPRSEVRCVWSKWKYMHLRWKRSIGIQIPLLHRPFTRLPYRAPGVSSDWAISTIILIPEISCISSIFPQFSFIIPNFCRGIYWIREIKMELIPHSGMTDNGKRPPMLRLYDRIWFSPHMISLYPLPSYYFRQTPRS